MEQQIVECEPVSQERQRAGWQEFAAFINRQSGIEAGIPVAVSDSQPAKRSDDGWTTVFPVSAADIDDGTDDSDDDTEEVDGAHKRKWLKAIFALLGGASHSIAAREAGVSSRQLSRWKKDPEFVELYQKTKADVFAQSVNGMKGVLTAAGIVGAKALQEIAEDKKATDTARVAAARVDSTCARNQRP